MEATYTTPPPPNEDNQDSIDLLKFPAYDISEEMEQAETNFKDELLKWFR